VHLGGDHDFFAPSEVLERTANDLFARAVRIDVGCIEERYAKLQRPFDEGAALLLVKGLGMVATFRNPIRHAAKAQARDLES